MRSVSFGGGGDSKKQDGRYPYPTVTVCMHGAAGGVSYGCDYANYSCASGAVGIIVGVAGFVEEDVIYNATVPNEVMCLCCVASDMSRLRFISLFCTCVCLVLCGVMPLWLLALLRACPKFLLGER